MREINHFFVQAGGFGGAFEIFERRFENIVVVVMNRNRRLRIDKLNRFNTLLVVHRHHNSENARAAEMEKSDVNFGKFWGNFLEFVNDERIAGNIEPQRTLARFGLEIQNAAHHVGQGKVNDSETVFARHRTDSQPPRAFGKFDGFPSFKSDCAAKAFSFEFADGVISRDNRQVFIQFFLDELVEMVAVVMRQNA